jgi:hypothetical protein
MKSLATRLFIALVFASSVRATVLLSVNYTDSYTQTSAGASKSWQAVGAFLYLDEYNPQDTAESAVAYRPDGSEMNLVSSAPNPVLPSFFWFDIYYPPQEAPIGDYTFAFTGGTRDGTSEVLTIDPSQLPPIAELTNGSFRSLSDADVSKPIRLNFKPQPARATIETGQGAVLTTRLELWSEQGGTVFSVPFDPRTSAVVIPAGTLKPAAKYQYVLSYVLAYPATPVFISYMRTLDFSFVTAAAKSQ